VEAALYRELRAAVERRERLCVVTALEGPRLGAQLLVWPSGEMSGDLGGPRINQRASLHAHSILPGGRSGTKPFEGADGSVRLFFDVVTPAPNLVIVGAVHVAVPLVTFAHEMGYRTVVVDPRRAFLSEERFGHADERVDEWPGEALARVGLDSESCVATLSHDPKLDLPALEAALASPARYVGALGSTRTHARRVEALAERGLSEEQIARIHAPIGLDLGGRRAEEIALAVIAEITADAHGK